MKQTLSFLILGLASSQLGLVAHAADRNVSARGSVTVTIGGVGVTIPGHGPGHGHNPIDPYNPNPYEPGYPSRGGGIRETVYMINDVERSVSYRNYNEATHLIRDIQDILSRYSRDRDLDRAQDSLVAIARTINDRYTDDYTKMSATRQYARDFDLAVRRSNAYARDGGGGYYPPHPPVRGVRELISCASFSQRRATCRASGYIIQAQLSRQYSDSSCVQGRSWGIQGDSIWVERGCRAEFDVIVQRY